jgi:hypothetical protein
MKFEQLRRMLGVASVLSVVVFLSGCESSSSGSSDSSRGGIDLSRVVWLDADVSNWAETATLNAGVSGGTLLLNYDKANSWPTAKTRAVDGGPLVGNCWVVVNIDGVWYAGTFDWMRKGGTTRPVDAVRGSGGHIPYAPLNRWSPRSGETYGFLVTTPARSAERTINERSNISMVVWP